MLTVIWRACGLCAAALAIIISAVVISAGVPAQVGLHLSPASSSPASEPSNYEWMNGQTLLLARASPSVVTLSDGHILVTGGLTSAGATATTEIFDVRLGSWKPGPPMYTKRVGHTVTLLKDGTVLVTGGDTGTGVTASAEILDATTSKSFALMNMAFKRSGHAAVLLGDGKVLVTGGTDWVNGIWSQSELYDPVQHKWTATGSMT
ncbi:MAG: hypothetical protein MUO81_09540, partial [Thermoplasmata archaeon]|nr:hypothetical protein [Thermoplasmata archaeon]